MARNTDNGGSPATILLAEDNPADQALTRRVLSSDVIPCDLRIVSDGEEALDYLLGRERYADHKDAPRPDLILLDINMPRLDGLQVLKSMRETPELEAIPVVVLTTSSHENDVLNSYKLGCNSFVNKPADVPEFIATLKQIGDYWLRLVMLPPSSSDD